MALYEDIIQAWPCSFRLARGDTILRFTPDASGTLLVHRDILARSKVFKALLSMNWSRPKKCITTSGEARQIWQLDLLLDREQGTTYLCCDLSKHDLETAEDPPTVQYSWHRYPDGLSWGRKKFPWDDKQPARCLAKVGFCEEPQAVDTYAAFELPPYLDIFPLRTDHGQSLIEDERYSIGKVPTHDELLQQSLTLHKALFTILYGKTFEVKQDAEMRQLACFCADFLQLADYYDVLAPACQVVQKLLFSRDDVWKDISEHPLFYVGISMHLESRKLFADAMNHAIGMDLFADPYHVGGQFEGPELCDTLIELARVGRAQQLRHLAELNKDVMQAILDPPQLPMKLSSIVFIHERQGQWGDETSPEGLVSGGGSAQEDTRENVRPWLWTVREAIWSSIRRCTHIVRYPGWLDAICRIRGSEDANPEHNEAANDIATQLVSQLVLPKLWYPPCYTHPDEDRWHRDEYRREPTVPMGDSLLEKHVGIILGRIRDAFCENPLFRFCDHRQQVDDTWEYGTDNPPPCDHFNEEECDGRRFNQAGFDPYDEEDQDLRGKFEADDHFTFLELHHGGFGHMFFYDHWANEPRDDRELECVHTERASAWYLEQLGIRDGEDWDEGVDDNVPDPRGPLTLRDTLMTYGWRNKTLRQMEGKFQEYLYGRIFASVDEWGARAGGLGINGQL